MYKAVIFDMDGVLIDSQPLHYAADVAVLRNAGYMATTECVAECAGMATLERFRKYRTRFNLTFNMKEILDEQKQILMRNFEKALNSKRLTAIDGIPELLAYIGDKHIKIALASSSSNALIELVVGKTGIRHYFSVMVSGEDVRVSKPAPDVFIFAAEKLGISPKHCLVIEDSANGIRAAKNAGMRCVAYLNPTSKGQDTSFADFTVKRFDEVYGLL
jgi:beta-phosphoglucomutase family hydrolase